MSDAALDYTFEDNGLLEQALTHRSAGNQNNERLEFLGDGVLNFIVAARLYAVFPDAPEGDLSRLRARLVRKETLASVAEEVGLGAHLVLGSGELKSGGHRRASILADALEAVVGAVYLDGGFDACEELVSRWFARRISDLPPAEELKDAKTRLQEYLQARQLQLPEYRLLTTSGADHQRRFTVSCRIPGLDLECAGVGTSRRKAEQAAAEASLERLEA